jgi:hypothetical protein
MGALVPFLLREPPRALPATCRHRMLPCTLRGLARSRLRGDNEAVEAVADSAHETAHGSISGFSLLRHPLSLFLCVPSAQLFLPSQRSLSLSGPALDPHTPLWQGASEKFRKDSTLTYTPTQGPLRDQASPRTVRHIGRSGLQTDPVAS